MGQRNSDSVEKLRMTKPSVETKGSNSDSLGNIRNEFFLPESELRHPTLLSFKKIIFYAIIPTRCNPEAAAGISG
ncbi:MAG: hypothetical protein WBI53_01315 [Paludibacter sp.]